MFAAAVNGVGFNSHLVIILLCEICFKGLFQTTSGASMYFVQPPSMTKDMSLTCVALDYFHHVALERIPRQDSSGE